MSAVDLTQIITAAVSAGAGGLITAFGGYVTKRHTSPSRKAQDFQTVVQGFSELVEKLEGECKRVSDKADAMEAKADAMSAKVGELSGVVETLTGHIDGLEATMRQQGMTPPSRPRRKASRV